jgi:DNA repair exonuclease SbcCD ATPase subunit
MDYGNLKARSIHLSGEIQAAERKVNEFEEQLKERNETLNRLKAQFVVHSEATEILRQIIERKSQDHLTKVRDLLSLALRTIFPDREYAIEIELDEKRGASNASFYLLEKVGGDWLKTSLEDGCGGSIRAIVGFVLQIFYIRYFKLPPVVFLDESFGAISESYVQTLMVFMHKLVDLKDFHFVLITHDPRVLPYVDRSYRIRDGVAVRLEVSKQEGK